MKLTSEQSRKIQVLKGIAIIAVVLIHNTPSGLPQVFIRPFLNFSVGLFLFLSGLLSSVEKWKTWKRISKVVIPYIIWTAAYTVLSNMKNISDIPVEFAKHLILGNSAAIMYYIWVYCEFTLLIPLIDKLCKSKFYYLGFLISPLEIIIVRLIPMILHIQINKYFDHIVLLSCLGWFTFFYLGYYINNRLKHIEVKNMMYPVLIGTVILQILEGYFYYSLGNAKCGTQLKLSAILTGAVFCLISYKYICSGKSFSPEVLKKLGDYSFGIYFSHLAVMKVLEHIPYYSQYCIYPFNAAVSCLLSYILVVAVRKILKNRSYILGM